MVAVLEPDFAAVRADPPNSRRGGGSAEFMAGDDDRQFPGNRLMADASAGQSLDHHHTVDPLPEICASVDFASTNQPRDLVVALASSGGSVLVRTWLAESDKVESGSAAATRGVPDPVLVMASRGQDLQELDVLAAVHSYPLVLAIPAFWRTAALTPTARQAEYEMPFRSP